MDKGSSHYGVLRSAVPTSYVIDRAGTIRYARAGAFSEISLRTLIAPLLAEPGPAPPSALAVR